eukprot:gene13599-18253_t
MIHSPDINIIKEDYIITNTGNMISRNVVLCKPQAVEIPHGRCFISPNVVIRGDLSPVQINKYCFIGEDTILRPSYSLGKSFRFIPITIGSHSFIGEKCIIEAAVIGMGCLIGNNCVLSARVILKDFVQVMEGSVIPPDMVVPPFAIVAGCPAKIIGERPESTSTIAPLEAVTRYKSFKPISKDGISS